jgi:hypothetical protein
MSENADLYERDFVAWTEEQAGRIRAAAGTHSNLPIDWERVAEEIEDLGKSDARELRRPERPWGRDERAAVVIQSSGPAFGPTQQRSATKEPL